VTVFGLSLTRLRVRVYSSSACVERLFHRRWSDGKGRRRAGQRCSRQSVDMTGGLDTVLCLDTG